jgi:hypothetical protein
LLLIAGVFWGCEKTGFAVVHPVVFRNAPANPVFCFFVNLEKLFAPLLAAAREKDGPKAEGTIRSGSLAVRILRSELEQGNIPGFSELFKKPSVAESEKSGERERQIVLSASQGLVGWKALFGFFSGVDDFLIVLAGSVDPASLRTMLTAPVTPWKDGFQIPGPLISHSGRPSKIFCTKGFFIAAGEKTAVGWEGGNASKDPGSGFRWSTFEKLTKQESQVVAEGDLEQLSAVLAPATGVSVPYPLNVVNTFRLLIDDGRYKVQFYTKNPEARTILLQAGKSLWEKGSVACRVYGSGESVFVTGGPGEAIGNLGLWVAGVLAELSGFDPKAMTAAPPGSLNTPKGTFWGESRFQTVVGFLPGWGTMFWNNPVGEAMKWALGSLVQRGLGVVAIFREPEGLAPKD